MRRVIIILVVVAVLGAGGWWAYQNYFAETEEPLVEREEAIAEPGTLVAMVNATGSILPEKQTTLSFKSPGRVAEVLVEEGQGMSTDEVLARLEITDLEFAVSQAEIAVNQAAISTDQAEMSVEQAESSLASAQAQLLRVLKDPAQYDIAAAESALESAKASYRRLVDGPTADEVRVARANLDQAKASLDQAQAAYDRVADDPEVAMTPQALQLEQATIAYDVAMANFELTQRDPSEAELAAARSGIVQAEAALARLKEGVSDEDLLVAQIGVEQAQIGVEQAQIGVDLARIGQEQAQLSLDQALHQLEGVELAAPHNGTLTMVGIKEGELTGGQPAFILTDLSEYHVDVTVDEIDIGRVVEGQAVAITLDALPGETLNGWVDTIADIASLDSGVVAYKVTVRLEPTDAPLRVGMTANVDIETERREGVILVPNRFIRIDRTTGQAFVDKAEGQNVQSVEIQIGLRDETHSEVLAGLEEGDMVVLIKESSRDQLRRAMEMGPPQ